LAAAATVALVTLGMASPAAASIATTAKSAAPAQSAAAPKASNQKSAAPLCAMPKKKTQAQCFSLRRVDVAAH